MDQDVWYTHKLGIVIKMDALDQNMVDENMDGIKSKFIIEWNCLVGYKKISY